MTEEKNHFPLYPLFMRLAGRRCLVIGGGTVAERKIDGLLAAGASVTVISPEATQAIQALARTERICWRQKSFSAADLEGAFLTIAATGDQAVNTSTAALCRARGIPVNVIDEPGLCDFLVPSVLRRGALSIAVSTEGKSPLLAQKLRRELELIIPEAYAEFLELLGEQREIIKKEPVAEKREARLRALVYSDLLNLLAAGKRLEARELIEQCISSQQG